MKLEIEVKFNIGDKVKVTNHNVSRMDNDGEGIVSGYIVNKTKKSCRVYYLIDGRGNGRHKYRYNANELELITEEDPQQELYRDLFMENFGV